MTQKADGREIRFSLPSAQTVEKVGSQDKLLFILGSRKRYVIPSERQRVEESTHFVDISGKIGA